MFQRISVTGVRRSMKILALLLIGITVALSILSCSRSCICVGASNQPGVLMSNDQVLSEVTAMARQTAPMNHLVWREKTRTAWLFAWTAAGKNEIKTAIHANPNLKLLQVERSYFPLDDLMLLINPHMRTVRCMGMGRSGWPAAKKK